LKSITPTNLIDKEVRVPGSKSYTHRALIAAALSDGDCTITNALRSEDTTLTMQALEQLGVPMQREEDCLLVTGIQGRFRPCDRPINVGNSGTTMRLMTAVVTLGRGSYTLTGSQRMQQRPIGHLIDGLTQMGIRARSAGANGCPPVEVQGGRVRGGHVRLDCSVSSQFLSALLLIAPFTREGVSIEIVQGPVSRPYIDITLDVMQAFAIDVSRNGYEAFDVFGDQSYHRPAFAVEPDCSQAGYFWAAAALTGGRVKVLDIAGSSRQGDVRFVQVLKEMGCRVLLEDDGIAVCGGLLSAVDVDMGDMPDLVPTLAVVAAFARGTTTIRNVAHLKEKESDRLAAVQTELLRLGIQTSCTGDKLSVQGGRPHGAVVHTYGDHRMAMSFAVAGLAVPGIVIEDEHCVEKSFPNFWEVFDSLRN
jgi:3-phosphoshikimate 1-carboxyvinyltransferase